MALFKFRFPGQTASTSAVTAAPNENIEVVRRRARHRLMGSVVLVLIAVVAFPLLFDSQPRPVPVDTPLVISQRQSDLVVSSSKPVPATRALDEPSLPASAVNSPQVRLDAREDVVMSAKPVAAAVSEPSKVTPPAQQTKEKEPVASKEPVAKEPTKPDSPIKPKDDGGKAQALLDGQVTKPAAGRLTIQVGAFSDAAKVREVRSQLEKAGLKTYTQEVSKNGKSTTRIRVGPYESRKEAEKVATRIRKLKLPAVVLTL